MLCQQKGSPESVWKGGVCFIVRDPERESNIPVRKEVIPTHFAISVRTISLRSSYAAAKVVGRMTDFLGL